jgi:hypothetical protein
MSTRRFEIGHFCAGMVKESITVEGVQLYIRALLGQQGCCCDLLHFRAQAVGRSRTHQPYLRAYLTGIHGVLCFVISSSRSAVDIAPVSRGVLRHPQSNVADIQWYFFGFDLRSGTHIAAAVGRYGLFFRWGHFEC